MVFLKRYKKAACIASVTALVSFSGLSYAQHSPLSETSSLEERIISLHVAENVLHDMMNKLETFRETGNFNVFHDIEMNKRYISGLADMTTVLDNASKSGIERFHDISSIKRNGKEQYNYYNNKCGVVTQILYNYLKAEKIETSILFIENLEGKSVLPKDYFEEAVEEFGSNGRIRWLFHTANIVPVQGKEYVLDPSHSSKAELLEDYINRFENPGKLKLIRFEAKVYLQRFLAEKYGLNRDR